MNPDNLYQPSWLVKCVAFLVLLGLAACSSEEAPAPVVVETEAPEIQRARSWANSIVDTLSLEAKIGHLVMVEAPLLKDSLEHAAFAQWLRQHQIGGVLLPDADRAIQARTTHYLQSGTDFPLWIGLHANENWQARYGYPQTVALGATQDDSLAFDWGAAIGADAKTLGAQLVFLPATRVAAGAEEAAALAADPELVHRLGSQMMEGVYSADVLPVPAAMARPDSAWPVVGDIEQWRATAGFPLEQMVREGLQTLQTDASWFSDLDSVPWALSHALSTTLLRSQLGFDGLMISPPLSDSLWTSWGPGQAGSMALAAGNDLLVAPGDLRALTDAVRQSISDGLLAEADLDERVHRNLFRKALLGLDTLESIHPDSLDLPDPGLPLRTLTHQIHRASLTTLRDTKDRLPLRRVASTKIASLHIGTNRRTSFQRSLDHFTSLQHFILSSQPTEKQLSSKLSQLAKFNYVLVGLDESLTQGDSLDGAVLGFLKKVQEKSRLVVVNFANPRNLVGLDSIDVVVHAYGDDAMAQEAAGQFLFGAFPATGKLPFASASFEMGTGMDKEEKIRLAYTEPEALGVDPGRLLKVDTLIREALYAGAFPGCQVLAAKDGEVFFHKSYGHHDYAREQRVRQDDVYDIASITKIAATTLMAMWSYEEDSLGLDLPLKSYITELDSSFITIKDITPAQLLIHKAGLPPSLPVYKYYTYVDSVDTLKSVFYADHADSLHDIEVTQDLYFNSSYMDSIWHKVQRVKLIYTGKYKYSDLSMFLLKYLLEEIHQVPLDQFVQKRFYTPLGLQKIGFLPLERIREDKIVPTENDRWWRHGPLRGYVHDQSTALLGGIGGQAGLFSNAGDLAVLMQMLLNGGTYGGTRFLKKGTVRHFTQRHPDSHRGLGFDMQKPHPTEGKGMVCSSAPPTTFGHTGFTGTCAWVDPENDVVFIFLSNRIHPDAKNQMINRLRVRQRVQQAIYDALGLGRKNPDNMMLVDTPDSTAIDSTMIATEDSSDCQTC